MCNVIGVSECCCVNNIYLVGYRFMLFMGERIEEEDLIRNFICCCCYCRSWVKTKLIETDRQTFLCPYDSSE